MQRASPGRFSLGGSRPVLPAVLLTAAASAFGGLALLNAPAPTPDVPAVRAAALSSADTIELEWEVGLLRASRSRSRLVSSRTATVPPTTPASPPSPSAEPRAKPAAEPAAEPTQNSDRLIGTSRRFGGFCPVPAANFTDTWGAPRPNGRHHQGTDLLAPYGSPVYAITAGIVDTTASSSGGISLYLRAANGDRYFYAHNSANLANSGERVQAGELIARVGTSGNAQGGPPHVHFERQPAGGGAVNPYRFLRAICR